MLLRHLLPLLLAFITSLLVAADNPPVEADHGTARVFPLLPPYQGVDFGANFNKLKSSGDAAYFVVRDSIVVSSEHEFVVTNTKKSERKKLLFENNKPFRFSHSSEPWSGSAKS